MVTATRMSYRQAVRYLAPVCLLLLTALFTTFSPRALAAPEVGTNADPVSELNVPYGPYHTQNDGVTPRQIGDIYYPADTQGRLPVIVETHGGAFTGGSRTSHTGLAKAIASSGYLVFNIDYYVSDPRDVNLSHSDYSLAIQFIKSHPRADPNRIGVFGTSAGAFMVISFCAAGETLLGDKVDAGVSWSGELLGIDAPGTPPEPGAFSSPCLMAGYGDIANPTTAYPGYIDYEQPAPEVESEAVYLSYQAFRDAGAPTVDLLWLKKYGHGLTLKDEPTVRAASQEWFTNYLR